MADKFYIHSDAFWGSSRRWAVYERTEGWPGWKRVSTYFRTSKQAEKLRDRMLADWARYARAMVTREDSLSVRSIEGQSR